MTARLRRARSALAVLLGVGLGLGAVEAWLRVTRPAAWQSSDLFARAPLMYEPDAELGWDLKPGRYIVPPYSASGRDASVSVLANRTRATAAGVRAGAPAVAFLGCSFTFGAAIRDEETFPWLLHQRFSAARILNYGRGGYGTYQALLLMERILAAPDPPRLIVYGLADFHARRNVADPSWLRSLDVTSHDGSVATPYATLDDAGRLVRHSPVSHPRWPLRAYLSTMAFLEERHAEQGAAERIAQAVPVTQEVLLEMDRLARRHGVRFVVVLLHAAPSAQAEYTAFLEKHQIDVVDCLVPLRPALQVPNEGHPNGRANLRWASCLEKNLFGVMEEIGLAPQYPPEVRRRGR
jgi:hypothetical protein